MLIAFFILAAIPLAQDPHKHWKVVVVFVVSIVLIWLMKVTRAIRWYIPSCYFCETVRPLKKRDFLKLLSGSDIRGVAVAGVEGESVTLTEHVSVAIAAAFAAWLSDKKEDGGSRTMTVSIGHDSRISASKIQDAVTRGLISVGVDVLHFGLASTPAMARSTLIPNEEVLGCLVDGAIMITAGHHPFNRNGFKFYTDAGGLGKQDLVDILEHAFEVYKRFTIKGFNKFWGVSSAYVRRVDYMSAYAFDLVHAVEKSLHGFHIVLDAGNGAGGFFVKKVLEPLGATTHGSQYLDPDGMFPAHNPDPEEKVAMKAITQAVRRYNADLGIIFDPDLTRCAVVDSTGREFNQSRLIALISAVVLKKYPGTTIVTDSVTSEGLTIFIEDKLGGKHHRFKRGYKNVIDEAKRLDSTGEVKSHLAMETTGHGAFKENFWLDDGAYLMVMLLNSLISDRDGGNTNVMESLQDLPEAAVGTILRLDIDENHKDLRGGSCRLYGEAILSHLLKVVAASKSQDIVSHHMTSEFILKENKDNHEGVKVNGYGGWFLLRLSLHDPVMPLNIEAPSKEAAAKLALFVREAVKDFHALDILSFDRFMT